MRAANSFSEWHLHSHFKMDNCFVLCRLQVSPRSQFLFRYLPLSSLIDLKLSIVALEHFMLSTFYLWTFSFSWNAQPRSKWTSQQINYSWNNIPFDVPVSHNIFKLVWLLRCMNRSTQFVQHFIWITKRKSCWDVITSVFYNINVWAHGNCQLRMNRNGFFAFDFY